VGDDGVSRQRRQHRPDQTPYLTCVLIALNVFVFVFLQGLGTNDRFTYAFSVVHA